MIKKCKTVSSGCIILMCFFTNTFHSLGKNIWNDPAVQLVVGENGWSSGVDSRISWKFDLCNDGNVSAFKVTDDSRPGG